MLLTVHANALYEILVTTDDDTHSRKLTHSRMVASDWILEHMDSRFSSPTERSLLHSFLSVMGTAGNLRLINSSQDPSELVEYEAASHHGGKNLIMADPAQIPAPDMKSLTARGTRVRDINSLMYKGSLPGVIPFETHALPHLKSQNPQSIVGSFFGGANHAVFYDKFINEQSCSFISMALSNMSETATIDIITSDRALSPSQIRTNVHLNQNQKLQIEIADYNTEQLLHERYCYIDTGYEIYAPRGLDCFGKSPSWKNMNTTISIFDNHDGNEVKIICKPHPGRKSTRTITVKSKIIL